MHARHLALLTWREENQLEHLMGDPHFHDPVMAGWWAWGQSCWIGHGWCANVGPWIVGDDGRITRREKDSEAPRVKRGIPHLTGGGIGVNRPQTREPGVSRQLPHLGNNGQGVNHAGTREPGVSRKLPHIGDNGRGVNHAGCREPGVSRKLPHLSNDGRGVNHAGTRELGVGEYHPMTMPELTRWFRFLSARLRHVRILNGDWKRACTNGATKILNVRNGNGACGVFLDPPYSQDVRAEVYSHESGCASEVAAWAIEAGTQPWLRIVYAGYDNEAHVAAFADAGWREVEWYRAGFLKGGMGNVGGTANNQQARERLWLSPHCVSDKPKPQMTLWG